MVHPDYIEWFKAGAARLVSDRGLTQAALARDAGLSQPQVHRLLSNKGDAGSETARRAIAKALKIAYEDLLMFGRSLLLEECSQETESKNQLSLMRGKGILHIDLPTWNKSPLSKRERVLLQETLDVLRSSDLGTFAKSLEDNIISFRDAIELAGRPRGKQSSRRSGGAGGR